jgi:hypothetical protein
MASLTPTPKMQFFTATGVPLVGGKLYTYTAGTTTALATYTDSTATTANTNPIILDARGECSLWVGSAQYKFVLRDSLDVLIWTADNINSSISTTNLTLTGTVTGGNASFVNVAYSGTLTGTGAVSSGATTATSLVVSGNARNASLGVGTTASGVTGEIRATGTITASYSDERLKTEIQPISGALARVLMLRGVKYRANDVAKSYGLSDERVQVGVLAQDVEKWLEEAVSPAPFDIGQNADGSEYSISGKNYKTVQYEKLVPLLIEAFKDLHTMIEALKRG